MPEASDQAIAGGACGRFGVLVTRAFAKINLSLEIVGKRTDGFHEIVSVTQLISLADTVEVSAAETLSVESEPPLTDGADNIAGRAACALAESVGRIPAVRVRIAKQIPVAAGLGGGSSNAAATLRLMDRLWHSQQGPGRLAQIGAALGSDVPLFLGGGTSLIQGRGERVERLPSPQPFWIVLVCPALAPAEKTRSLYQALGPADFGTAETTRSLAEAIRRRASIVDVPLFNSFDTAASRVYPDFPELRRSVTLAFGRPAHLTGAGPSLFAMFASAAGARRAADRARTLGHRTVVARSVARHSPIRVHQTPAQWSTRSSDR
jgi:4-diphosphocytidyl-2-C-methyl-D-erythritol kinase